MKDRAPFRDFAAEEIESSLSARFQGAAAAHPERLAVTDPEEAWTYGHLNRLANGIAEHLLLHRLPPHQPVVLLFDNGALLIAAILAVWKAGHFYIPLDPAQPLDRLQTIFSESQARVLLCDGKSGALAHQLTAGMHILPVDGALAGDREIHVETAPTEPCYVLYTSGSTGRPKGVLQTHRNVLFDIRRLTNDFQVTCDDRFALLFNPGFSASIGPILGALLNGASLHIYPLVEDRLARLAGWLQAERITLCDISVMAFRELTRTSGAGQFPAMRVLGLGGERVDRRDFEQFRRCFSPGCLLQNGFGATETRTISQFLLRHDTEFTGSVVPVGWTVEGKTVALQSGDGKPVPDGETGEIVVRSRYLSPGYWKQPELTAAAFCDEPSGYRTYRTGDLARRLPDGSLLHLGRRDSQVKIRGHRVEPAEVEAALASFEMCREAAVAPVPTADGRTELVAYLVPASQRAPTVQAIRSHLSLRLPAWLIPSEFVLLEALPRLANGKLDVARLPSPASGSRPVSSPFLAPRDSLERALHRLATEVFGAANPGVNDDFFDLGCDSLKAIRFLTRLEEDQSHQIPFEVFFREPTVAALAQAIRERCFYSAGRCLLPIQRDGSRAPLICFPGITGEAGNWFHLSRYLGAEQPVYSLQARGLDGETQPHLTVPEMAAFYAAAIQQVPLGGAVNLLGYSIGGVVAHECASQLLQLGIRVNRLILIDCYDLGAHRRLWQSLRHKNVRIEKLRRNWRKRLAQAPVGKQASAPVLYPVREAILQAVRTHRPRLFQGRAIFIQPRDTGLFFPQNAWKLWRRLITEPLDVRTAPGDHFTMCQREHARELARELTAALDRD